MKSRIKEIKVSKMFDTELMQNVVIFTFINDDEKVVNTIVRDYNKSKQMMMDWVEEMLNNE